jgi:hypothetical protein
VVLLSDGRKPARTWLSCASGATYGWLSAAEIPYQVEPASSFRGDFSRDPLLVS